MGKSSLVNALAGYRRSVVSPTPGTTRDLVTVRLAIGWPIELVDTAGLREETEALEGEGIDLARRQLAEADLVAWVLDSSAEPVWPPSTQARSASDGTVPSLALRACVLPVINKMDLPPAWDLEQARGALRISARTGEGLAELCSGLEQRLVPEPPPPGAAVPFTPELCDVIEEAQQLLSAGRREQAQMRLQQILTNPRARGDNP